MILQLLISILGPLLCYVIFHVAKFLHHDLTSPLRGMVGPKSPSLVLGNFMQMAVMCSVLSLPLLTSRHQDDALVMDRWRQEFGPNFVFTGLFNVCLIFLAV
jgi:hypothetical protein